MTQNTVEKTRSEKSRSRKSNSVVTRFNRISSRPRFKHLKCQDKLAVTFRPNDGVAFQDTTVAIEQLQLVVMAATDVAGRQSMPVAVYRPRVDAVTAQVHYDALSQTALYDAGLRRGSDTHPCYLQVTRNRSMGRTLVALSEAVEAQCDGQFLASSPVCPTYLFASDPSRPLRPEVSNPYLIQAARDLHGLPLSDTPSIEQRLAAFRRYATDHGGLTCYPQEFFLRDTRPDAYQQHPVTRTRRPSLGDVLPAEGTQSPCGGWVFHEASWYPKAQVPKRAYAVLPDGAMGVAHRNPAFSVLKKHGVLPETADYRAPDETMLSRANQTWTMLRGGVLGAVQTVTQKTVKGVDENGVPLTPAYDNIDDIEAIPSMSDEYVACEDAKLTTDDLPKVVEYFRGLFTDAEALERLGIEDEEIMAIARDPRIPFKCVAAIRETMRERLGGVADRCTQAAMDAAVGEPMKELEADLEAAVQVIELHGNFDAESTAFGCIYGHVWLGDYSDRFRTQWEGEASTTSPARQTADVS